jgi:hypothetical protein
MVEAQWPARQGGLLEAGSAKGTPLTDGKHKGVLHCVPDLSVFYSDAKACTEVGGYGIDLLC